MKILPTIGLLLSLVVLSPLSRAAAQEVPNFPMPQKEHEFLKQFVGDWDSTAEATMPGQPPMKCKGTYRGRMLGGFWIVSNMKTSMMGMEVEGVQQIGYDTTKRKYVGTWLDSMMNHLWQYEGTVTDDGKTIHLDAEGPNMLEPGKTAKFRDSYTFATPDHLKITSSVLGPDGKWVTFMKGEAKRKK